MAKLIIIRLTDQVRKTIRSVAGSMDTTASDLIRGEIKENLRKINLPNPENSSNEK